MLETVRLVQYVNLCTVNGLNKVLILAINFQMMVILITFLIFPGVPKSGEGFIDFIGQVHKTKEQFGQDGPISVHCSAGVGRTGVFITLSIVLERMQYEGVLDVFQTVRILRSQRPAMVQTEVKISFNFIQNQIFIQ